MCLIAFAWGASERFPFVVAANRDEFLERHTAPLSIWQSPSGASVLSGRDLKDGGTWMGFSPSGRFAMLTNVRAPQATPPNQPISRGGLALSWLDSDLSAAQWAKTIDTHRYLGFNLIVGDWQAKQCHYLSSSSFFSPNLKPFSHIAGVLSAQSATDLIVISLPLGCIYGLSNAALDTPWHKSIRLKSALKHNLLSASSEHLITHNLQALASTQKPAIADLPVTGISADLELALSSIFVSHPQILPTYGTRTSLVAVFEQGQGKSLGLQVTELTHSHQDRSSAQTSASLNWR